MECIELAKDSLKAGCYEYEMNNGVQEGLELNLLRAFCLQKKLSKCLDLK
jgi:hypothetical protein